MSGVGRQGSADAKVGLYMPLLDRYWHGQHYSMGFCEILSPMSGCQNRGGVNT